MELNKIEKQIKMMLDSHTIQPSTQAWDRLDAMLTIAEKEKSKRSYNWLYGAASFLGFILIGTIFFNKTQEIIDVKKSPVVIESKAIEKKSEKPSIKKSITIPMEKIENIAVSSDINKLNIKNQARQIAKQTIPDVENKLLFSTEDNCKLLAFNINIPVFYK